MAHPLPPRLNVARVTAENPATLPVRNRLATQERRRQARRLRVVGLSVEAIALRLAADPAINSSEEGFEGGYGHRNFAEGKPPPSLETLRKEAAEDLKVAYERSRDSIDRDEAHMFDIALERIEYVVQFASGPASRGSNMHQGRIIEATELQARIMGWIKSPVTVNVDQSVNITSMSPQPVWDTAFLAKFTDALVECGGEPPEVIEAAQSVVAQLTAATPDPSAIPVESTEA